MSDEWTGREDELEQYLDWLYWEVLKFYFRPGAGLVSIDALGPDHAEPIE